MLLQWRVLSWMDSSVYGCSLFVLHSVVGLLSIGEWGKMASYEWHSMNGILRMASYVWHPTNGILPYVCSVGGFLYYSTSYWVVLYRGFGRSGGKRFSGWFHKRISGRGSKRINKRISGRSFLGPKFYGVGLGGLGDRGLGRRRDYLCSVGEDWKDAKFSGWNRKRTPSLKMEFSGWNRKDT